MFRSFINIYQWVCSTLKMWLKWKPVTGMEYVENKDLLNVTY